MPPNYWREIDSVKGLGELVFEDGTRIRVHCEVASLREYNAQDVPQGFKFAGRVWAWSREDPFLIAHLIGKDCILEMEGRRLSVFITDKEGHIAHGPGVVKGFPGLTDHE